HVLPDDDGIRSAQVPHQNGKGLRIGLIDIDEGPYRRDVPTDRPQLLEQWGCSLAVLKFLLPGLGGVRGPLRLQLVVKPARFLSGDKLCGGHNAPFRHRRREGVQLAAAPPFAAPPTSCWRRGRTCVAGRSMGSAPYW